MVEARSLGGRWGSGAVAVGIWLGAEELRPLAPGPLVRPPAAGPGLWVFGVGAGELRPGAGEPGPLVAVWRGEPRLQSRLVAEWGSQGSWAGAGEPWLPGGRESQLPPPLFRER